MVVGPNMRMVRSPAVLCGTERQAGGQDKTGVYIVIGSTSITVYNVMAELANVGSVDEVPSLALRENLLPK